jgi:hypothetical protein
LEKEISGSFIVFAAMDTIFAGLGRGGVMTLRLSRLIHSGQDWAVFFKGVFFYALSI